MTFGMFCQRSTVPSSPPKPGHGLPVDALIAIRRPSTVGRNSRCAHSPVEAAGPGSYDTPRQVRCCVEVLGGSLICGSYSHFSAPVSASVSYTHLTLPTKRIV